MKQWAKKIKGTQLVLLVLAIELLQFFFLRKELGFILSPILYTACGFFYFFYLSKNPQLFVTSKEGNTKWTLTMWQISLLLVLFFGLFFYAFLLIQKYPININDSDIIPLILDIYVDRLMNGEAVYAAYTGFNYGTFVPNYMPFHWLPFTLVRLVYLEPRMVHTLFFFLIILTLNIRAYKVSSSSKEFMLKAILPFVFAFLLFFKQGKDYAVTVEMVIAFYYVFLGLSFFSSVKLFQVIGLGLSILSRYSLLFWLPVWEASKLLSKRKEFYWMTFTLILFCLLFYVIPFVIPNPEVLQKGSNLWVDAALNEWDGQDWQAKGDKPFQLFQGLGFASWFHQFYPGTLSEKLMASKNALLGLNILGMIFLIYFRIKNRLLDERIFLLLSLKFCLTIFFAFVFIPYVYLFWVPISLSLVIVVQLDLDTV